MKPLFIPLKAQFYEAFENGTKDTEYRKYGPRWNADTCFIGRKVTLSYGYGKKRRLSGEIVVIYRETKPSTLPGWIDCYGDTKADALCIKIKLDRFDTAGVRFLSDDPLGDWPEDFPHENGNYMCRCIQCGKNFMGHKRRCVCKTCNQKRQ